MLGAGAALHELEAPVWRAARERSLELRVPADDAVVGQGVTLGMLGGFRAITADFLWLRMYSIWEQRDLPATQTLLSAVSAVDPRPLYFWLNGTRILAYDMPVWRIEAAGGYDVASPAEQKRFRAEQAAMALRRLAAAMRFHPASAELWIERANIELNQLGDLSAAAASYRRAWEQPHAPYYAARLHAEMLRRAGRHAEAYAWLRQLHPGLPRDEEAAAADVVLVRIRELERTLGVAPENCYVPGAK